MAVSFNIVTFVVGGTCSCAIVVCKILRRKT
jgi:hypothetical protein